MCSTFQKVTSYPLISPPYPGGPHINSSLTYPSLYGHIFTCWDIVHVCAGGCLANGSCSISLIKKKLKASSSNWKWATTWKTVSQEKPFLLTSWIYQVFSITMEHWLTCSLFLNKLMHHSTSAFAVILITKGLWLWCRNLVHGTGWRWMATLLPCIIHLVYADFWSKSKNRFDHAMGCIFSGLLNNLGEGLPA